MLAIIEGGILIISAVGALPLAYYLFQRIRPDRLALGKWKALFILLALGIATPFIFNFSALSFLEIELPLAFYLLVFFCLLSLATFVFSVVLSHTWRGSVLIVYPSFWILHFWAAWGFFALIFGIMGWS